MFGKIGIYDTPVSRAMLRDHFNEVVQNDDNILRLKENEYGVTQVRESLFMGPGGIIKLKSAWLVANEGLMLTTVIPKGKQ
ncbi:hypothetical protein L1857_14820 [Amycolatopsis thermalba]|uniref:Uncharacterized protein n=1 Tax=Amycolatopsis thermalba TaxID=944492 RepID=A0ABY4NVG2_9PSEU|nr:MULTISPECIES: hypothetical protein [Amycolatopsis]UQS24011.1 hypothetical protein L1857_14820 [Amycolatopsis thermalba]